MKKFYTSIAVALMAVLTMTAFSSCENDEQIAYDLSGEWQGYMGESYYDYWGYENYAEYYTVMHFYRNDYYRNSYSNYSYGATSGQGEQIDYPRYSYSGQPYYRYFRWRVDWGTIYIDYDTGEEVRIYSFSINNRYFSGTMEYFDRYGNRLSVADFDFTKTYDFNWDTYYRRAVMPTSIQTDSITITK